MGHAHNHRRNLYHAGVAVKGRVKTPAEAPASRARRAVNLSIRGDLLEASRQAGVNLSAVLERAVAVELVERRRDRWRKEQSAAIAGYNRRFARAAACFAGKWIL